MDWDVEMDEGPHLDGTHSIADYEVRLAYQPFSPGK